MELNKIYCTNNLELLKQLPNESVDLIYCDILYNTGKKFKDYDDNLGTPQEAIEWYRPRLIEMKRVLKDTGNILFYSKSKDYIFNIQYEDATSNKLKGCKKKMIDVWDIPNINNMSKERIGYDTQKPKELLTRIIKASSNEGDIVADFFCGSGTSLVVAKELNRNYIGCDINPRAVEITNKRLDELNN